MGVVFCAFCLTSVRVMRTLAPWQQVAAAEAPGSGQVNAMNQSATFRAAYINRGAGTVLTTPEQSTLTDSELRAAALSEAMSAGLIGDDAEANQLTAEEFADALVVGNWTETH